MTVKFFGQFLLERGEIDDADLRRALDLMELENQTLGELAALAGFASNADCRRVNGEQRRKDMPFGELAVQMGVLNTVELEELLARQRDTRLTVAAATVRLGMLAEDRVAALYDEFKSEQQPIAPRLEELPVGLTANPVSVATLGSVARFCERIARIEARLGDVCSVDRLPDDVHVASVGVQGLHGAMITMMVEQRFGEKLATGILGMELPDLAAELALESVGEFLNVLLGNVLASLEADEGLELRLAPPSYGVLPTGGYCFPIATEGDGRAHIILAPVTAS